MVCFEHGNEPSGSEKKSVEFLDPLNKYDLVRDFTTSTVKSKVIISEFASIKRRNQQIVEMRSSV
jgi:hypothetical protein